MGKRILGIDIGQDSLKIAQVKLGKGYNDFVVEKTVSAAMPLSLIKEGRIISLQTMSNVIRVAVKQNNLKGAGCSLLLPNEVSVVKNISVPQMSANQLEYNLPFEFKDYVSGESKDYLYDYAVINNSVEFKNEDAGEEVLYNMDLTAAFVHKDVMSDIREVSKKSGLRLLSAVPAVYAYQNIIRGMSEENRVETDEYCFVDLGYNSVRIYMFRGDAYQAVRILDLGLSSLDSIVGEEFNVDERLAHTYFLKNYEGCQSGEKCSAAYTSIATEISRALNYYKFTNRDSLLNDIWLCGGGAQVKALCNVIISSIDSAVHSTSGLIKGREDAEDGPAYIQAVGCALLVEG